MSETSDPKTLSAEDKAALQAKRKARKEAREAAGGATNDVFNRQALVLAVAEKTGLPRAKALVAVEAVFDTVSDTLKGGKEVRVLGFGSFVVSERKPGKGRDPRTGAEIDIPRTKSVRFRAGKGLREKVAIPSAV